MSGISITGHPISADQPHIFTSFGIWNVHIIWSVSKFKPHNSTKDNLIEFLQKKRNCQCLPYPTRFIGWSFKFNWSWCIIQFHKKVKFEVWMIDIPNNTWENDLFQWISLVAIELIDTTMLTSSIWDKTSHKNWETIFVSLYQYSWGASF